MPPWRRAAASRGGAFARTLLAGRIRTGVAIRMAEPEDVTVRGVMMVVVVAVRVARAPGPGTVGREEERERDRENAERPGAPGHARSLHRGTSDR